MKRVHLTALPHWQTVPFNLPPIISTRTPDGILLILGIQAGIIPRTITNNIGVDANRDFFSCMVTLRSKVK